MNLTKLPPIKITGDSLGEASCLERLGLTLDLIAKDAGKMVGTLYCSSKYPIPYAILCFYKSRIRLTC